MPTRQASNENSPEYHGCASAGKTTINPFNGIAQTVNREFVPVQVPARLSAPMDETLLMQNIAIDRKYKRDICKNWRDTGFCRFGDACNYAHGLEEMRAVDRLTEDKLKAHEIFKTQNCRAFWKGKFCQYGKRCQFRHEHRGFEKIHKHFYMDKLAAIQYTSSDILAESNDCEYTKEDPQSTAALSFSDSTSCDSSSSGECDQTIMSEPMSVSGRSRLDVFQSIVDAPSI